MLATTGKTIPYSKDLPGEDFPQCEREHSIVEQESHSSVRCEVDLAPGSISAWHIAWSHGHEALTAVECTGHLTYQWLRALYLYQKRRFQYYMLETVAGLSLTSPLTAPRVHGAAIMSEPALADSGRQAHLVNPDWSRATDSSYIHSLLFKWRARPSTKTYPAQTFICDVAYLGERHALCVGSATGLKS